MLKKIFAILFVILLSLQMGREMILGIWFSINQAEITELFCINKQQPELECHGKCHLKKTLEADSGNATGIPGLPGVEDRFEMLALPANGAASNLINLPASNSLTWQYRFVYDFAPAFFVFHPPRISC